MKKITLALVIATVMVAGTAGSAQALPTPILRGLPSVGDSLFVFPCGGSDFATTAGLVDVASGTIAGRGTTAVPGACIYNGDYDVTTKISYVIDNTGDHRTLATFDPATGSITPVGAFYEGTPTTYRDPLALTISATGLAYASGNYHDFYTVNLATAEMIPVGDAPALGLFSFDINPIDGVLYAISYNAGGVYTINPTDGVETLVGAYPASASAGMQFDSAGVAWFQNQQDGIRLFSATDLTQLESSQVLQGTFTFGSAHPYVESLLYVPAPAEVAPAESEGPSAASVLADTGISELTPVLAAGATAILFAGGVVFFVRRRRDVSRPC